jgi:DNA polymerase IV
MYDRPDDFHTQGFKVDVLPFERQNLFGPEASALCHHYHRPVRFRQQSKNLVILLDCQNDRPFLPLADAFDFDELHRIPLPFDHLPQHGLFVQAIHDCLDVTFGLWRSFHFSKPCLNQHRLYSRHAGGSPLRANSLDDAQVCPEAIFIPPDFVRYKEASKGAREIFLRHTDLIEPLSLDEAYLDVTANKTNLPTATRVAKMIREQIREELNLTASAGVAPNKFLAKIASDWRKPNGLFVIQPHEVQDFLLPLPVGRIPGVGKVTESRMKAVGIATVGDLYRLDLHDLESHFGSYGTRLYQLTRGIDHNPVEANRVSKSISAEDTFQIDIPLTETEQPIRRLAEKVWRASRENARGAKTVVLKLKTKEFNSLTRSLTPSVPPSSCDELTTIALALRERVELGPQQLFRLVGVGLSNFQLEVESPLLENEEIPVSAALSV